MNRFLPDKFTLVLLAGASLVSLVHGQTPSDGGGSKADEANVGFYPTFQSSTSTMNYVPGWEPTYGQSPTSLSYGGAAPRQGRFSSGVDRLLTPLVPYEATWNSSAFSSHFSTNGSQVNGQGALGLTTLRANSGLWLDQSFDPRSAEVKLGPLFLDFNSLEAIALWSDVSGPFANGLPDDGFIAMFGLNVSAFLQLTERTYFKANGTLYWVPTSNEIGFFFGSGGATYATIEHRFELGRWDVHLYDTFDVFHPLSYLLSDLARPAFDQSGLYRVGYEYAFTSSPWKGDYLFFRNLAGAEATTFFGKDFRFRVGYEHWETWQSDNFDRLTPVDHLSAGVFYENPIYWYRPWVTYDSYWQSGDISLNYQQVLAGVTLPFRRDLTGFARFGYAWWEDNKFSGPSDGNLVWDLGLTHYINSSWSHAVQTGYSYQLGPRSDDESFGYYANYALRYQPSGGRFGITGLVQWQRQEWDDSQNWLTGLQANYIIDTKTSLQGNLYYWDHSNIGTIDTEAWLYRIELVRYLTQSLVGRLSYQYTDHNSTAPGAAYDDHLLMLSLTKYF